MSRHLTAGVAGAGVFGSYHAQKIARLEGVRLAAVFDADAGRAARLAATHGAVPYTDYDAFLEGLDAVIVATPATTHHRYARAALDAGRHVLVEKPIATALADAEDLVGRAAALGLVLQVGHQERFVADALGMTARKEPPRAVWCRRMGPRSGRCEDVSVVLDLMIHDLDLLRRLGLGALSRVSAEGGPDAVDAELAFEGGATASLAASRAADKPDRRITLAYDAGVVEIDFLARTVRDTTGARAADFGAAASAPGFADPLGHGVAMFLAAIEGRGATPIPGAAGRDALDWALKIEAALAQRAQGATPLRSAVA